MSERFTNVFSLASNLYTKGCPIIIEAGALLKDTETGNMLAQLKMKNIGERPISSCKVSIRAYENNGTEIEGVKDFSYLDLLANTGDEFGSKIPIFLPDDLTRSFSVTVNEIVFQDKTSVAFDSHELNPVPVQEALLDLDEVLITQYKRETTDLAQFKPAEYEDLWMCTCGGINKENVKNCAVCSCTKEKVFKSFDEDYLKTRKEEYDKARADEQRQREKEAAEHKEKIRKKTKKIITVLIIAAVIVAMAIVGVFVYKRIATNNKYNEAIEIGKAGEYEKAIKQLESIDPYKESSKYINTFEADIIIENADSLIADGDYSSVSSEVTGIDSSVIPSKERKALKQILNYAEALSLLDIESSSYLDGEYYGYDEGNSEDAISLAIAMLDKADAYGSSAQIKKMISDNEQYIGDWEGTAIIDRKMFHKKLASSEDPFKSNHGLRQPDYNHDGFDDDTGEMLPLEDFDCNEVTGTTRIGIKRNKGKDNDPGFEVVLRVIVSFDSYLNDYCEYYEGDISLDEVKNFKLKGADEFESSDYASLKIDKNTIEGNTKNKATIQLKKQ